MHRLRRRVLFIALVSAAIGFWAATVQAQVTQGYTRYHEGNSLCGPMVLDPSGTDPSGNPYGPPISTIAKAMGDASPQQKYVFQAGTTLDWVWPSMRRSLVQGLAAPPGTQCCYNSISIEPFRLGQTGAPLATEAAAGAQIIRESLKTSPDADVYAYFTWVAGNKAVGGDWDQWRSSMQSTLNSTQYPMLHILRQEFPDKNIYVIPAQQAFMKLYDVWKALPDSATRQAQTGFATMESAFESGGTSVHPERPIYYLSALTNAASFYQASPQSAITESNPNVYNLMMRKDWQTPSDQMMNLTYAQASTYAQWAWDAVLNSPGTVMNSSPLPIAETVKPNAFTAGAPTARSAMMADINWQATTDNVGVTAYSVYVNGEIAENWLTPGSGTMSRTISNLTPGINNVIKIRAWDASSNFTDTTVNVTMPTQSQNVLVGFDAYGAKKNGGATTLAPLTTAAGVTSATALAAGHGLTFTEAQYFSDKFDLKDIAATNLAQAIANNEYLTFSVTLGANQKAALDALTYAGSTRNNAGFAIFTSATGLPASSADAGLALDQWNFMDGTQEFEFQLRNSAALQNVSGATEFRVYLWNNSGEQFGRPVDTAWSGGQWGSYELSLRGEIWASRTWQGGVDGNWSNPGNWTLGAPANGDDLVFTGTTSTSHNDATAGVSAVRSMVFQADAPLTVTGQPLSVKGDIRNDSSFKQTIAIDLTLAATGIGVIDTVAGDIELSGTLTPHVGLTKKGAGHKLTLTKAFSSDTTTTVSAGTLEAQLGIDGGGTLAVGGGAESAIVFAAHIRQSSLTINGGGKVTLTGGGGAGGTSVIGSLSIALPGNSVGQLAEGVDSVPEPGTLALLAIAGLLGALASRRFFSRQEDGQAHDRLST